MQDGANRAARPDDRYRLLVDNLAAGVFVSSLDGKFLEVSERVVEMAGYASVAEMMATPARALYADPADRERLLRELTATGAVRRLELRSRRKDGTLYWISMSAFLQHDAAGQPASILGIVEDVTERKRFETRLREAQSVARLGHYELDIATGTWTGSETLDAIFGIDAAYPRTVESWLALAHPDEHPALALHFAGDVLLGGRTFDREYRIVRPVDGEERWVHGRGKLERGERGRAVRLFGTLQDVTERRREEQARLQLEDQLRHSQKMEAIGLLAGGVAHDLNNLLTPILIYGGLLRADGTVGRKGMDAAGEIMDAATRAQGLVRQLMAFGRKQVLDFRRLDLNSVVADAARLLARTLREDIALDLCLGEITCAVRADGGQIEQALLNLAINAQDAMPNGGTLVIATGEVAPAAPGGALRVRLSVSDTGVGMDPDTQARIFEPFFTTKELGKGTGLGLSTVYGIVRQHGGDIRVHSRQGEGTVFEITIPADSPAPGARTGPRPRDEAPRGSETVILAEDEAAVRASTVAVLEHLGYQVVVAGDLGPFPAGRATLLLTDVVMPGLSGPELYERMRREAPGLKVLYMSGYPAADAASGRRALRQGDAFLQKPFTIEQLARKIREVLDSSV